MGVTQESSLGKEGQLFRTRQKENLKMKHLLLLSMATLASCAPQSLVVTTTSLPCNSDEEGCIEVNTIPSSTVSPISITTLESTTTPTITTPSTTTTSTTTTTEKQVATEPLETTKFHIKSEVQFRYARTVVESTVTNPDAVAQVASFALVIPDSAFISAFSMEIGGEKYEARVEEKEEAEKTFEKALSTGRGAGLVSQDAKDANKFTVSTNIEGDQEVVFRLTYDELLGRKESMYRQEINIDPQQIVDDFRVEVYINESLPITEISVPELLELNTIDPSEETQNSFVKIEENFEGDAKKAKIVFAPTPTEQRAAAEEGMSGRLQINYDVDRQNQDSEVQVIDGYFVHFFVPENLETLPKHAIFILDVSGSMHGEKLQQLKDAMFTVLNDMKPEDFFNIITFSSSVSNWSPSALWENCNGEVDIGFFQCLEENSSEFTEEGSQPAIPATKENKKKAISHVLDLEANGGTNMNSAMLAGLELAKEVIRSETLPQGVASMLVFLSDGEATEGETSGTTIKENVAEANSETELPIFSVAFGSGADFDLLKEISLAADSFAKRVYEGSDAALQLENFYNEISSPVVTNLKFDYVGDLVDNSTLSNGEVKTLFKGDQYVVVGKLLSEASGPFTVQVTGDKTGTKYFEDIVIEPCLREPKVVEDATILPIIDDINCFQPIPGEKKSKAQEFLQSLHAFLNIQQLLKKDKKSEALKLALENHFVTPVTSLVVVQPDEEDTLVSADKPTDDFVDYPVAYAASFASFASPPRAAPQPGVFSRVSYSGPSDQFGLRSRPSVVGLKSHSAPVPKLAPQPAVAYYDDMGFESFSYSDLDYYDDQSALAAIPTNRLKTQATSTTTSPPTISALSTTTSQPEVCKLTLFSKTYNRGDELTLLDDSDDLGSFSDIAISAQVEGLCCWQLFGDLDFAGSTTWLRPGESYKGTDSFGRKLFRDVSSVRRVQC